MYLRCETVKLGNYEWQAKTRVSVLVILGRTEMYAGRVSCFPLMSHRWV